MKKYLEYTTNIAFKHTIADRTELVDSVCLQEHQHDNVVIQVAVEVRSDKFLDFKTIKAVVENRLKPIRALGNLNEVLRCQDATTEKFAEYVKDRVGHDLVQLGYKYRRIGVRIKETEKYGVMIPVE